MDGSPAMPHPPTVAVLLSTYNGEAYLEAQLDSLRAQRDVKVELYVRDDGSLDATCAILNRYVGIWPTLGDVRPGVNLGSAASFLHLLQTVPGTANYYAFCDQDDIWLPDKLARAVVTLKGGRGPALYCSNLTCVAEDLRVLGVPPAHSNPIFQDLLFENVVTGCTIVLDPAARALINSCTPASGVVIHDWWCALVIAALGTIHYDPFPSLLYRQHGSNVVGLHPNQMIQGAKQARRLLRERRTFLPVHAQASELLRLYGDRMPETSRIYLDQLVASKNSRRARINYAVTGPVKRRKLLDATILRSLILAGWY